MAAKPTETNDDSPLEKWRRWKDKVFEADSVVSEEPPAEPVPVLKETPRYQQAPQKVYGSSGGPDLVPIKAPPPKGEPTMMPIDIRRGSGEPTMIPIDIRRGSGEPTMVPIQAPPSKGEATMAPIQAPPAKGEPTMFSGKSRQRQAAEPTMTPARERTPGKGATMFSGESRQRQAAEPTMTPAPEAAGKGEATMVPGESRDGPSAGPTMMDIQAPPPKGEATMMPIQAPPPKGEATMIQIDTRRGSGEPTMVEIQAPPAKGEATMVRFIHSRTRTAPFRSRQYPKGVGPGAAPIQEEPDSSHDPERDKRAISTTSVKTVIDELRSVALQQGLDFSIIQPDSMKIDFFTDSRALRVKFTGSEIAIDRIVVKEFLSPPDIQGQSAGGNQARPLQGFGEARRRLLEREQEGFDARKENAKIRVATFRDKKYGDLDWHDANASEKAALEGQVAIEACYFDVEDGRNWFIELVNGSPAPDDEQASASGGELTPEAAKGLVMLLLDILRSITEPDLR